MDQHQHIVLCYQQKNFEKCLSLIKETPQHIQETPHYKVNKKIFSSRIYVNLLFSFRYWQLFALWISTRMLNLLTRFSTRFSAMKTTTRTPITRKVSLITTKRSSREQSNVLTALLNSTNRDRWKWLKSCEKKLWSWWRMMKLNQTTINRAWFRCKQAKSLQQFLPRKVSSAATSAQRCSPRRTASHDTYDVIKSENSSAINANTSSFRIMIWSATRRLTMWLSSTTARTVI